MLLFFCYCDTIVLVKKLPDIFNTAVLSFCGASDKLALAVSGGMDSMCMLHLALESKVIDKKNLLVVSVDHQIRGQESKNDLEFVKDFCAKKNIEFSPLSVNVPKLAKEKKQSLELAAREVRRDFFKKLVDNNKANFVLLAHHSDDNIESICMNIFRGAGLNGLKGMQELSNDFLLRPLLNASKAQITAYMSGSDRKFVEDSTNADTNFTRNSFRLDIIPAIKKHYPSLDNAILSLSKGASEFLNSIKLDDSKISIDSTGVKIKIEALKDNLANYYVLFALEKLGVRQDFYRKNIDSVVALANAKNGTSVDLPNGFKAVKEYKEIVIFSVSKMVQQNLPTKKLYFDADKIPKTAIIRNRQDGDIFTAFGGGTKKLKEFLIDKKIPVRFRDNLICLADGKNVLLVVGVEISESIKCDASTKNKATISTQEDLEKCLTL